MSLTKRNCALLSLEVKLNAVYLIDKRETIIKIALDLGVEELTVGDWRRKRNKIEKWCCVW